MIPYGRQDIREEDVQAVLDVLRSDFLTQGPVVTRFEEALARAVNARHGVATNSATSALHVACLALGVGPGDSVWTSPITFVASANCARYCGAEVDFVDIDPSTGNMSVVALREKLDVARREGRLPKVLIPVHYAGQPCDMTVIAELADEYGFSVIEDASHAIGAVWGDEPIGSCRFSDITIFSFHPVKIVTTGEGGMALTNDTELAARMSRLRSHGITRDPELMDGDPDGSWYYQQVDLGFNYRMTDLAAALGISQLSRLSMYVERRRQLAARYDRMLSGLPCVPLDRMPGAASAWHLYVIRLSDPARRREAFDHLKGEGVGVNVHYIPVHLQPYYRALGFSRGQFPAAESFYASALTLPLHPRLSDEEQRHVVDALRDALEG